MPLQLRTFRSNAPLASFGGVRGNWALFFKGFYKQFDPTMYVLVCHSIPECFWHSAWFCNLLRSTIYDFGIYSFGVVPYLWNSAVRLVWVCAVLCLDRLEVGLMLSGCPEYPRLDLGLDVPFCQLLHKRGRHSQSGQKPNAPWTREQSWIVRGFSPNVREFRVNFVNFEHHNFL